MRTVTTFEWKGGLKNLVVSAFGPRDAEPVLWIDEIKVRIENNYDGTIDVKFRTVSGRCEGDEMHRFIQGAIKASRCGAYSSSGLSYSAGIRAHNGEPVTVTVAKGLFAFLRFCGIHAVSAPRIVEERFLGRCSMDSGCADWRKSYGEHLFEKLATGQTPEV